MRKYECSRENGRVGKIYKRLIIDHCLILFMNIIWMSDYSSLYAIALVLNFI